jgi:hypothetical protein
MKTWSTDLRHLESGTESEEAATAARRPEFVRELVEAATSRRVDGSWSSATRCTARLRRKACRARIHVERVEPDRIAWSCTACGERGEVIGFAGTAHDMSSYVVPKGKKLRLWGFDDESREVLRAATAHIPTLRAVVARAYPAADVEGLLILQATIDELDAMYTLVEDLADMTRSRRRRDLLEGLRWGLSTSIDGF